MSAILIRCILLRAGGSKIKMDDNTLYHFKDDGSGHHVAVVADEKHQARLLSIPEAYAFHAAFTPVLGSTQTLGADLVPAKTVVVPTAEPAAVVTAPIADLAAGLTAPAATTADLASTTAAITLPEDSKAPIKTQTAAPEKTATADDAGKAADAPQDAPKEAAPVSDLEAMPIDDLRKLFEAETGKAPSATKKAALMISQITALRAERERAKA